MKKTQENISDNENLNGNADGKNKTVKRFFKKAKNKKTIIIALAAVVVVFIAAKIFFPNNKADLNAVTYTDYTVEKRDIEVTLTGTGTLQPIDSYTVTANVSGDIISADFEEMDKVEKDQVLYVIDSDDAEKKVSEQEKTVSDAREDYNEILSDYKDLYIYSEYEGTVEKLYVEEGDTVQNGQNIASIVDNGTMLLEIPFFTSDADHISSGDTAYITFSFTPETISGTVKEVSYLETVNSKNSKVRNVTIAIRNPGGISNGTKAYAKIGNYACSDEGTFKNNVEKNITAKTGGKIKTLYVKEGSTVGKGTLLAYIDSENLDKQKKSLLRSLENAQDNLETLIDKKDDYTIKAPISGTVVSKNYKALDTIGQSSLASTTDLAVIYDMSSLTFDLNIDELDLYKIEIGQEVIVTSDSIENTEFSGYITKKSIIGNSSNGTTTYPVTVQIDDIGELLPGMNVDAKIMIKQVKDVLAVPVGAVARGNTVEVKKSSYSGSLDDAVENDENSEYASIEVGLGESDDDYVEITYGLSEGDVVRVAKTQVSAASFDFGMAMGGDNYSDNSAPGGGPDGGGPGGMGGSGGTPGGNSGGMR